MLLNVSDSWLEKDEIRAFGPKEIKRRSCF
jgi:hypothetical protein